MTHTTSETDAARDARGTPPRTLFSEEPGRPLRATIARWPLEVFDGFERAPMRDPWLSLVRDSIVAYREGRSDVAEWAWSRDIEWRVAGTDPTGRERRGGDPVFEYHRMLSVLTDGTYRQRLVALEPSGGPIVEAHVRTLARRRDRALDIPTLIVFELHGGRVCRVHELPGDRDAWEAFWGR